MDLKCSNGPGRFRLAHVMAALLAVAMPLRAADSCFKVFDGTAYRNKPDGVLPGFQHVSLVDPTRWWAGVGQDDASLADATGRATAGLLSKTEPVIVDLELELTGKPDAVQANIRRYTNTIDWMRAAGFSAPLAFYSGVPNRDYWRAIYGPGKPGYRAWQAENDFLTPIVDKVDALYPSLYTFYADQMGWVQYALANISEARRVGQGKPVYPFLWPQFHNSAGPIALQFIDFGYWLRELRTVREHADGVVIWGGWDFKNHKALDWDEAAPWWQATRQFLGETVNLCRQ